MTTIVYRDGIMAADSRAYGGDKHPIGHKVKIRRLEDGTLIGCSTTVVGGGERVLDWYAGGCCEDDVVPDSYQLLVAKPNGDVFLSVNNAYLSGPLTADFFTIGSGEAYAYGACMMGATAVEAVRAACLSEAWTDFPIFAISHKRKTMWRVNE